jgi:hypothetical protein
MDALTAAHDAVVQMIDTSVVRVHQHGACVADNERQHTGGSRGGLTSKIALWSTPMAFPYNWALHPPGLTTTNSALSY